MAFDVITPIEMGQGSIGLTVGTFYTVLTKSRGLLKNMDISNNSTSIARVTVYLVPSGGSPDATNILIPGIKLMGNTIFQWAGIQVMNEGGTIQAISSIVGVSIKGSGGDREKKDGS